MPASLCIIANLTQDFLPEPRVYRKPIFPCFRQPSPTSVGPVPGHLPSFSTVSFSLSMTSFSNAALSNTVQTPHTLQTPSTCFYRCVSIHHLLPTKIGFDELKKVGQDFFTFLYLRFSAGMFLILSAVPRVVFPPGLVYSGPRVAFQCCMGQDQVKGRDRVIGM